MLLFYLLWLYKENIISNNDLFTPKLIWKLQNKLVEDHNIDIYFFKDIPKLDEQGNTISPPVWYRKHAQMLAIRGILDANNYYDNYLFRPSDNITREEFFVSLMKAINWLNIEHETTPAIDFSDWNNVLDINKDFIKELQNRSIIDGHNVENQEANILKPKDTINRAEVAKVIVLAFQLIKSDSCIVTFDDVENGQWYTDFVKIVHCAEIVKGYSNTDGTPTGKFKPSNSATRAEAFTMLHRAIEQYLEKN
ncbi:MAG: S-layer homology domain-containing protein [Sulfurovum sp.]